MEMAARRDLKISPTYYKELKNINLERVMYPMESFHYTEQHDHILTATTCYTFVDE